MKRVNLFFVLLLLFFFFGIGGNKPEIIRIKKVVIDAGHGGNDPGAVGKKSKEKDITLSLALKLGNYIKANFPEIEIVYTRKTDVFVELYKRAQIANNSKADLFISIHCNSTKGTEAQGTETWVMGLHKSQANLEVAKLENASILFEDDYSAQYDGFDPNSPEANIIFSLYQNAFLDQSLKLAECIQKQFLNRAGRINRGVKQAGFLVLYKTTMPGVLIEAGFISNPQEEEFLLSESGQAIIASAIYRAFKEYKNHIEGGAPLPSDLDSEDVYVPEYVPEVVVKKTDSVNSNNVTEQTVSFRVQFYTSTIKIPLDNERFKGLKDVGMYFHSGLYKYTSGNFPALESAVSLQREIQSAGFKDAFVVAFLNDQRISQEEALKLLKK